MSQVLQSYKRIANAVDNLGADCQKCLEKPGKQGVQKAYPGFQNCWRHMSRANRGLAKNSGALLTAQRYGFYTRDVNEAIRFIYDRTELFDERHRLYDPNILEELALARLALAGWLKRHADDEDMPLPDIIAVIKQISQVAEIAQRISKQEEKRGELTPEMVNAIVTGITHAFHKANLQKTDLERAQVFAAEITKFFTGGVETINTTTVPIPDDSNLPFGMDTALSTLQRPSA